MSLTLVSLDFSHDPPPGGARALRLRRNASRTAPDPAWQPGFSREEDSVAAYAIEEVVRRPPVIRARFAANDPRLRRVEVRAVHPALPAAGYPGQWILETQVNVLGETPAQWVALDPQGRAEAFFPLPRDRLVARGVGVNRVTWHWQSRTAPGLPWQDFAVTRHTIYTVLRTPTQPWTQLPGDALHLPWTDVLEHSCRWAAGASSAESAAAAIVRRLYALGGRVLVYDALLGQPRYSYLFFNCTEFLRQLGGGSPLGPRVNCSDCATAVSTFANILGCDLWQSQMGTAGGLFPLNLVIPIGLQGWQTPLLSGGFGFHEVAWSGACTEDDPVFDACLAIDAFGSPSLAPRYPVLPANLRFGRPGEPLYRYRLAAPAGQAICVPRPETRQRRRLGFTGPLLAPSPLGALPAGLRRAAEPAASRAGAGESFFVQDFRFDDMLPPDWETVHLEPPAMDSEGFRLVQAVLHSRLDPTGPAVRIDGYECNSTAEARELMLSLAAHSQTAAYDEQAAPAVGDWSLAAPGGLGLLFCRGNLVCSVANAGLREVPVLAIARWLDAAVLHRPDAPSESPDDLVRVRSSTDAAGGVSRFEVAGVLPLPLAAAVAPAERPTRTAHPVRFFVRGGEIQREHGRLHVVSAGDGPRTLEVIAIGADGTLRRQRQTFEP